MLLFCLCGASTTLAAEPVQVQVKGVEDEALANVQAALTLPAGLVHDGKVDRRWLERFAGQSQRLVEEALRPFGYYRARAAVALEEIEADRRYRLTVTVAPGEPVRVERVDVAVEGEGAGEPRLLELVEAFPLRRGEALRQDRYEQAKGGLKARAIDLGYLDAEFAAHRLLVDPERGRAEVELRLATGPRYRFGEVLIHGAPDYPDRFLRRYLVFRAGEPFSYARLGQTQLNLLNSDRFREVIVTPRPELAEDLRVPVGIQLVPSARRRLRPGIGYGTDTGARASLLYKDVNLLRRGHELNANLLAAEIRQQLGAAYLIPSLRDPESQTALRAGLEHEDPGTYERRTLSVEVERVHGLGAGQTLSGYVRLLQEDYEVGLEESRSRLVLPGSRYALRRYDDPVRPSRGYQGNLEVRGTHQMLASDTGLLQLLGSASALLPLPARLAFFGRVQAGATWQNEPLREIPPSLRFFAGGDQSVRGYAYQSLGPRDASGKVVGGKNLLVGSVELERSLAENWGVAAFYDAGNAFDSFSDYEIFEGAGLGVRRYTPVGPIRLDLARQLGVPDPSFRFHVSVGFGW